jgi:hypothetical protein
MWWGALMFVLIPLQHELGDENAKVLLPVAYVTVDGGQPLPSAAKH